MVYLSEFIFVNISANSASSCKIFIKSCSSIFKLIFKIFKLKNSFKKTTNHLL